MSSALHSACFHNHSCMVELLLEEGADPSIQAYSQNGSENGETCADWAYERGMCPIFYILFGLIHLFGRF